jgi:hypothetical protein
MKNIRGSEIYYVDENGVVYSRYKKGARGDLVDIPVKIKQSLCGSGYPVVHLYEGGKRRTAMVHRLVADAFIPNQGILKEVNHIDGDKLNNRASNLEWVSASQNQKHAVLNGLKSKPPRSAKLSDEQVLTIRTINNKEMDKLFAGLYDVDKSSICRARLGHNYKHIS